MKAFLWCFTILCIGSVLAQRTSESALAALEAKVAAVNITDFYLMLGNEDGLFFTYQQGTRVQNTSHFSVASASKWVSSVLFNTLIYNGAMSLLDRPQDYIDWWTDDSNDKRSRVRVQHLLNFQSGLARDQDCVWDQEVLREDCVKSIYENGSLFEPGNSFVYSENHMHTLALMAEKKTGKTFLQLFEELIKQPLGLTVSTFPGKNPRPSSSLNTNVIEYEKILRSIFMKTILPPDVIDMMEQDQTNVSITLSPANDYGVGWHYALGHWVECPYEKWNSSCLTEINRRSSPGGLGYYPWVDRKMNYYGILATYQSKGFYSAQEVEGFRAEIHAVLAALNPTPTIVPVDPSSPVSGTPSKGTNSPLASGGAGSNRWLALFCASFSFVLSLL